MRGNRWGKRRNHGTKLSHDLPPEEMESEEHRIVVLISGFGTPQTLADSLPLTQMNARNESPGAD